MWPSPEPTLSTLKFWTAKVTSTSVPAMKASSDGELIASDGLATACLTTEKSSQYTTAPEYVLTSKYKASAVAGAVRVTE